AQELINAEVKRRYEQQIPKTAAEIMAEAGARAESEKKMTEADLAAKQAPLTLREQEAKTITAERMLPKSDEQLGHAIGGVLQQRYQVQTEVGRHAFERAVGPARGGETIANPANPYGLLQMGTRAGAEFDQMLSGGEPQEQVRARIEQMSEAAVTTLRAYQ